MYRVYGVIVAVFLATPVLAIPPTKPSPQAPLDTAGTMEGLRGRQCGKHLRPAIAIASDPRFSSSLSREMQVSFLWQIANCGYSLDKDDVAFKYADRAIALNPDIPWLQVLRLYYGYRFERTDASLDALKVLSRIEPDRVREMDLELVVALLRAARKLDPAGDRSLAVHSALNRAKYVPAAPNHDDFLRMDHGRLLLARGRVDDARRLLQEVVDVDGIIEMRIDRRFDPLRSDPAFESRLDVAAAAARDVARSRAVMERNPKLLEAVYLHGSVLNHAMRYSEGLAAADKALARDAADPGAFTDAEEYRNWIVDMRGSFLYKVGRTDEGRAAMTKAAGLDEHGDTNVSNIINLSGYLVDEGRAADAVALIPRIGKPSPYGQAWVEAIRSCAGVQLKDEALRIAGLDYLKAHEADNPAAYSRALLCSNDLDEAAALMIRRLSSEDQRVDALKSLQVTPDSRMAGLPFYKVMRARFDALRAREDVRAAASKVGRIETLSFELSRDL